MSHRSRRRALQSPLCRAVLLFVTACVFLVCADGQKTPPPHPLGPAIPESSRPPQTKPADSHELSPADISAFLDGLVSTQLAREDIAGAVVSIVKDGKVLFAKGYGYSDVAKRTPVSPTDTLFRPGSVTKLITWTAVFQQVEQGKLNLDRDINDYLDFKIPPAYGKPITLRNLMTHTPGLEDLYEEIGVPDTKSLKPIGDVLKDRIPARIFPPGTTPAYSNYGATIAGYIVERVSGQSFNDYLDEHIFKPLGMTHSTCRQPLPGDLIPLMSKGYKVASEPPGDFEVVEVLPAGSCSATAADMSNFMLAHLQGGSFQGRQILPPETVELMHARQFTTREDMNGLAGEFYEETRNGHRIIGHAGDTLYFHTDLHLIPDVGLGFYVSYNSLGKGENSPRTWLWQQFLDRYFPYTPNSAQVPPDGRRDIAAIVGRYRFSRRAETTLVSFFDPLEQSKVYANSDGTISVDALKNLSGQPRKFQEIGPLLFRENGGQEQIAFQRDHRGRLVLILDFPVFVLQRVPWNESKMFLLPLLAGSAIILLLGLLLWPVGALLRRHYGHKLDLSLSQRRLRLFARLSSAAILLFMLAFIVFLLSAFDHPSLATPHYDPLLRLFQIIGWIGIVSTLGLAYFLVRSWAEPNFGAWRRTANAVTALSCVTLLWFAFAYHLFTWNLLY